MLKSKQREFAIYLLDSTLDWIARSDDWFKRSELGTRCISLISELGRNAEAIFNMPADYIVTDYTSLRKYRDKLDTAIDEDDPESRFEKIFEFELWLHEIKLLHEEE